MHANDTLSRYLESKEQITSNYFALKPLTSVSYWSSSSSMKPCSWCILLPTYAHACSLEDDLPKTIKAILLYSISPQILTPASHEQHLPHPDLKHKEPFLTQS